MSSVDNTLGNILIKHHNKWRGYYYLTIDLTFTFDISLAARFYLLKSGDTTIINGDRISINSGNRTLSIDESNNINLIDRTLSDPNSRIVSSFLITNGSDNTDPITYETAIYLISDKDSKTALKYEWGMDLISPADTSSGAISYNPHDNPSLINGYYGGTCTSSINSFEFILEKADGPITNLYASTPGTRTLAVTKSQLKGATEFLDGYKGAIMIILLIVILILCIIVSK